MTIQRAVNSAGEITKGKNKNAQRTIILGEIAMGILADQRIKARKIPGPWLFPDEAGGPARPIASQYWFQKTIGQHVSPYCLRHTFVSLTKNQLPDALLKQVVGHCESMDTHGVYGKVVSGEMEQAAKIIDLSMAKWLKFKMEPEGGTITSKDDFEEIKKAENT